MGLVVLLLPGCGARDGASEWFRLRSIDVLRSYPDIDSTAFFLDSMVAILVHRDGRLVPVQVKGRQKIGLEAKPVSPTGK